MLSVFIKVIILLRKFYCDKRGVTSIEYAILGIGIATIVSIVFNNDVLQDALTNALNNIGNSIQSAG
ncbi:Flp family type IVb pilin [Vibrio albus]|uniref:Flp family type IVb pilin n=1 Tax=Vibrio albus TaxID=2200953 RepID=A0A2U3BAI1_9VIBR|nr:Flp family type IVb pilin [Vibrio albus]